MRLRFALVLLTGFAVSGMALTAQKAETYKAHLAALPINYDVRIQVAPTSSTGSATSYVGRRTVLETGKVSATLLGTQLSITGTFEGLRSSATIAQLRKSPVTGVRGPVVADLTVSKGSTGTLTGTVVMTPVLMNDLRKGRLYVQIHSEIAPDGNVRGWLLP